jgi:hypothetical protein
MLFGFDLNNESAVVSPAANSGKPQDHVISASLSHR